MKSIDRDFKHLNRRRPIFSRGERALLICMLISGSLSVLAAWALYWAITS